MRKKLPKNCEFREYWHSDCDSVLGGVMECLPTLWVFIGGLSGLLSRNVTPEGNFLSFVNIGWAGKAFLNEGHT